MSSSVEQIKARLSIVDVAQTYIKLQKAGANFKANCPFHSEKTPSFFVSPGRESWHCFGCNRGGDIFSFVMEIEGVEFLEALKILANRAGVELQPIDPKHESERAKLLNLMSDAEIFYEKELRKSQQVISYLKERGLTGETVKEFRIGFAPDGWRNLLEFLKPRGYSEEEMIKSGMAIRPDSGGRPYDRFRSRIMFPVSSASGQIVGFSGRIFGKETEGGKYINTPQTDLYDKSRILYGFNRAKAEIRKNDYCVLVEGQMDVIMSHQAGLKNTVAVSGTALTSEHLKLIKRLTDNLVMAFDADIAGRDAMFRGIDMALAEGMEVKAAVAPFGKDPADAVRENPENWLKVVREAKNIFEFYLNSLKDLKQVEKILLPRIAALTSDIEKAKWVAEIARRFRIGEEPVWAELKKIKFNIGGASLAPKQERRVSRLEILKRRLVGLLLWKSESADETLRSAINSILEKRGTNLENLKNIKGAEKMVFESELIYSGKNLLEEEIEILADELEKEEIRIELEKISFDIREAEEKKDSKLLEESLKKFNELTRKLHSIK